ncbi:MAG: cupin domain-containing protein [Flavobacteriaceae bacterium]|nr:cupin domain-containing protein [Flavobacteriaceae bacterium]
MNPINILEKFELFNDYWTPKKVGELNGQQLLLAKLKGTFIWHTHEQEDELFFIIKGCLKIEFRDKTISLNEGEMGIIPKGVEHKPIADEEVWVMLFEPLSIKHTGNIESELTVKTFDNI